MSLRARLSLFLIVLVAFSHPPAQTKAEDSTITHVVQPGDTLLELELFYGRPFHELTALNDLQAPYEIATGRELSIPVAFQVRADEAAAEAEQPTYVVQRGDTLFRIATRFSVPMDALAAANNIVWVDRIYVGQVLTIPGDDYVIPPDYSANTEETIPPELIPQPTILGGKQIIVVLSQQRVYAFENGVLLRHFLVSTGLPATPTVQGDFQIYSKLESQRMTGPGYDLPGVPWVMYFYRGYALHGTYWHNNFGNPMSHGCVNLRTPEAEWLYFWAPVGTAVRVIY